MMNDKEKTRWIPILLEYARFRGEVLVQFKAH
jgi:hypothetical protein